MQRLRGYRGNSSHPGVSIFNGEIRPGRAFKTNIYPASFAIRFFQVEGNKDEIYHRVHAWWPVLTGRERGMWKPEGLEHKQSPPGLRGSTSLSSFMELNPLSTAMVLDSDVSQTSILSAPPHPVSSFSSSPRYPAYDTQTGTVDAIFLEDSVSGRSPSPKPPLLLSWASWCYNLPSHLPTLLKHQHKGI